MALYCHRFGVAHLELIEDAIQDAFQKAIIHWDREMPANPKGWIYTVSKNRLLDQLKRNNGGEALKEVPETVAAEMNPYEIKDNKLKMMFACSHPDLPIADQLLLSLKFLCGLGNRQIARVLLKSPAAVERASSRAKLRFQALVSSLEVPDVAELSNRLRSVLKVIYLQFTEGYKMTEGEGLINKELCTDAIKLAELVVSYKELETPDFNAVLALMYFQTSRLDARTDEEGRLLTLEHQDRKLWNYRYIMQGNIYFSRSAAGKVLSTYHIEAAVASYHAAASSFETTDWEAIFQLYTQALNLNGNPFYRLGQSVALSKLMPAQECLPQILEVLNELPDSQYTYVLLGDLYKGIQNCEEAERYYLKAKSATLNLAEKAFVQHKIDQLYRN